MEPSTQDFLEIKDIRDGVLLLKNNQIRGILMVSSINFALKSTEEQNSIVYAFQNFLNSLDFSCQILMQSRHINITPYLDTIKNLEEKQNSELLKLQTASYVEFIKELVKGENVMTKNFFVVVSYNLAEILGVGSSIKSGLMGKVKEQKLSDEDFEKCKNYLWQRMEFAATGLKRCELDVIPLTTPELIELFWSTHHPSEAEVGYYPEILPELLK
ncbi:MAG: hypothetical protein AAB340_01590 [Patescibacteria group bacterium]